MKASPIILPKVWTHDCAKHGINVWRKVDHFDGRSYYWNIVTDETRWIPPAGIEI